MRLFAGLGLSFARSANDGNQLFCTNLLRNSLFFLTERKEHAVQNIIAVNLNLAALIDILSK